MIHHISSRPSGTGHTEPDETPQRQRRFTDQRGIALQTVIIMVVLLAIAGAIAAVLLSRGNEAATQLESQNLSSIAAKDVSSESLCNSAGGLIWDTSDSTCKYEGAAGCAANGGLAAAADGVPAGATKGDCVTANAATGKHLGKIK